MPEYLAPGVYIEEVSFRSKSIEGVPTSTTGFAGMTRTGPVQYPSGPAPTEPRLVTSFTEFERIYGGLQPLRLDGGDRIPYLAHAARAFFLNGGKRLYVSRVFDAGSDGEGTAGVAGLDIVVGTLGTARWQARWPGSFGNVAVRTTGPGGDRDGSVVRRKTSLFSDDEFGLQVRSVAHGTVLERIAAGSTVPGDLDAVSVDDLLVVMVDRDTGEQTFFDKDGAATLASDDTVRIVEMNVAVEVDAGRMDFHEGLATHPAQTRYVGRILQRDDPEDENAVVWLDWDPPADAGNEFAAARLLHALTTAEASGDVRLGGGHDGAVVAPTGPDGLEGSAADPDDPSDKATGLAALAEVDDVAIVAVPDGGAYTDEVDVRAAADALITHAERAGYRFAVVDGPDGASMNEIRDFRGRFDSSYAALYHPWIEILDPTQRRAQGAPPERLLLPPSGFVCGVYARTDVERGVHKAPANEVVRGLTRFESNINTPRQDVLNPEGINALRFFEGRGNRIWGARTMSSDPEWKYVNVRRLFLYIEHSIFKSTQWAVFEPNNRRLWSNIRNAVEDFLLVLWRQGALMGETPDEAYFVRCDRTTMTQNDLDNGRLVCLVGIAPTKPAEFVIFRIGQWTADADRS
jgi:hypothetical protein